MSAELLGALDAADAAVPRPELSSTQAAKKNYAERLSRNLAQLFADRLRPWFQGILPDQHGGSHESRARSAKGIKKLDVNYSTVELGLGLGVSIKTINFRDPGTKRYTKNYTRVDGELRAEAQDYHKRQPYAVMAAIVFIPADACDDGGRDASSFGSAVRSFRPRAGRGSHLDEEELFERVFVAIYHWQEPRRGDVWFFDVMDAPPRHGPPRVERRLSLDQVVQQIRATYDARNNPPFDWDDG